MKKIIIANWKCNPITLKEAERLFDSVKRRARKVKNVEIVICPPFVYLLATQSFSHRAIKLGSQDCFWEQKGAFTGEVSPLMLKNLGCKYVIVGHSERRRWFGETDEMLNKKIKAVLSAGLKPIFCIGETLKEREDGRTFDVLKEQIEKGLVSVSQKEIKDLMIAYEPVWAIGTGKACPSSEAITAALFIRKLLNELFGQKISKTIPILYGGSVNIKNAADYTKEIQIQGLLVGGASLDAKEFIGIAKRVSKN